MIGVEPPVRRESKVTWQHAHGVPPELLVLSGQLVRTLAPSGDFYGFGSSCCGSFLTRVRCVSQFFYWMPPNGHGRSNYFE